MERANMINFDKREELDDTSPDQREEKEFLYNLTEKILESVVRQKFKNKISNLQYWVRATWSRQSWEHNIKICSHIHVDVTDICGWGWNIAIKSDNFVVYDGPHISNAFSYPMADPNSLKKISDLIIHCINKTIKLSKRRSFSSEDINKIFNNYEGVEKVRQE